MSRSCATASSDSCPPLVLNKDAFVEVHSLSNGRDADYIYYVKDGKGNKSPRDARKNFRREFNRAVAAFANQLARSKDGKKNKELAKALIAEFRQLGYEVFSRLDPQESPHVECFSARNLVFRVCADDNDYLDLNFGEATAVLVPKKKLSLPFNIVATSEGQELVDRYIPCGQFTITLPFDPRMLMQSGRDAKHVIRAFNQGCVAAKRQRNADRMADAVGAIDDIEGMQGNIVCLSTARAKPNHDRAAVGRHGGRECRVRRQAAFG